MVSVPNQPHRQHQPNPNENLVKVFESEQESEALVVAGLLQSNGIECFVRAIDMDQELFPVGGVMILVCEEDAPEARTIIEEYRTAAPEVSNAASEATEEPSSEG